MTNLAHIELERADGRPVTIGDIAGGRTAVVVAVRYYG